MMRIVFAPVLMCVSGAIASMSFKQSEYEMKFERAELKSYNTDFLSHMVLNTYKYNRTYAAVNATLEFKKNMGPNFKIQVEAYMFMSNEYRSFPILFSYNFCEGLRHDDFGMGKLLRCGNLTKADCPFRKGTYHLCNFAPNGGKFPPHVPEGRYMVDLKWFDGPVEVCFVQGYGIIQYKLTWFQ